MKNFLFLILICLIFQACDSGSKKTAIKSFTFVTNNTIKKTLVKLEEVNNISKTKIRTKLVNQVKTETDLIEWKKELSNKLKPIPLAAPTTLKTQTASTTKERISAKDSHKTELIMKDKSKRYNSIDPTKEFDISETNRSRKLKKVEFEKK